MDNGQGRVKTDQFFSVLEDSEIPLTTDSEFNCRNDHCVPEGDFIRYEPALRCFRYLTDTHEWVYNRQAKISNTVNPLKGKGLWSLRGSDNWPRVAEDQKSQSTTFTELIQPRRYGQRDKQSIASADIDARANISNVNVKSKTEYLNSLLASTNEEERQMVKSITSCVKFMYKHHQIDYKLLNKFFNNLVKDYLASNQAPTHLSTSAFVDQFSDVFGLHPSSEKHRHLIERVKSCLVDTEATSVDE